MPWFDPRSVLYDTFVDTKSERCVFKAFFDSKGYILATQSTLPTLYEANHFNNFCACVLAVCLSCEEAFHGARDSRASETGIY